MMKILLLSAFDIFPPSGGVSTSIHNILKQISKNHEVHILLTHFLSERGENDLADQNVKVKYCPRTIFDRFKIISVLFNPFYFWNAYSIMRHSHSDVIQCQTLWTVAAGIFLKKAFHRPLILVQHDVQYLKLKSIRRFKWLCPFIKKIEALGCRLADKVIAFSSLDKKHLMNLYNVSEEKIEVIVSCPDLDMLKENKQAGRYIRRRYGVENDSIMLMFVGSLDYRPNFIALQHIVERIYPEVIERYPKAKFVVVGRMYQDALKYQRDNFILTGYLPQQDFVNHVSTADILLVPVDAGSGLRRKILDAAALGKAIVSTRKGAEGLDFVDEEEIMLARDTDRDFVAKVIKLIEDKNLRHRVGINAREKILRRYNWKSELRKLERVYQEVR